MGKTATVKRRVPVSASKSVPPRVDLSPRDQRLKQWASDIHPTDGALEPLAFERSGALKDVIDRANVGLDHFRSLGIAGHALESLVTEIRRERTATRREREWPSLAEDKAQLKLILEHAEALRDELEAMSMRIEIALNTEYHEANTLREAKARAEGDSFFESDDLDHVRMQEQQLPGLIEATVTVLRDMPFQARPLGQVHLIEIVAKTLEPFGIRPSKSPTSRFHRACHAAFDIANVQTHAAGKTRPSAPSPTGSIRAFMGNRGKHSRFGW